MNASKESLDKMAEMIAESDRIVFFTGAGISVPSGIPDFRSANGIYQEKLHREYSPEEMVSHSFLLAHPEEFFSFYREKMVYPEAVPNRAHELIASIEKTGKNVTVVTQNIDGLHEKAGSKRVLKLHGSVSRNYCVRCRKQYGLSAITETDGVPKCTCGGMIRPDVVLYEEPLDERVTEDAVKAIRKADMMVIIGTSLIVYPAASYVRFYSGDRLVINNLSRTSADQYADLCIYEDCERVAEELRSRLHC